MNAIRLLAALIVASSCFAQSGVTVDSGGSGGAQGVWPVLHIEPPSRGPWAQRFNERFRSSVIIHSYVGHRFLAENALHVYFGYDLLIEAQSEANAFKASFYDLSLSSLDVAGGSPAPWKKLPPPKLPPAQVVHSGDVIRVELWQAPDTGQKIIDDIHIDAMLPYSISGAAPPPGVMQQSTQARAAAMRANAMRVAVPSPPNIPTVSGTARPFSVADAEMHVAQPRLTVNGKQLEGTVPGTSAGSLVWFYLPGRGRYILSLVPRPNLGFTQAGEVRGGKITFNFERDSFTLECPTPIAPGDAP